MCMTSGARRILHAEGEGGSVWWSNLVSISHGEVTTVESWINDHFVSLTVIRY